MATGGRNMGRVGVITHRERHDGGFNIVHIKDAIDNSFATRETNVFVIGNEKPWISLPKGKGVKVRHQWNFFPHLPECPLIMYSYRLRRRGIVVVRMQLQVTRLSGTLPVSNPSMAQPNLLPTLDSSFKKIQTTLGVLLCFYVGLQERKIRFPDRRSDKNCMD